MRNRKRQPAVRRQKLGGLILSRRMYESTLLRTASGETIEVVVEPCSSKRVRLRVLADRTKVQIIRSELEPLPEAPAA